MRSSLFSYMDVFRPFSRVEKGGLIARTSRRRKALKLDPITVFLINDPGILF